MNIPTEPIRPVGQPLPLEQVMRMTNFSQRDLEQAIARAHRKLKPYLIAGSRKRAR